MATAEAVLEQRDLSGDKAQRIIEAMRAAVAERGAAGATFEIVAHKAGVSRGLLHYYFRSKERLLVEVVKRDTAHRVERLDAMLAEASTADGVIHALVASLEDTIANDPGYFALLFELFIVGREHDDVQREMAQLFATTRDHVAEVLEAKQAEGVLKLRCPAPAVVSYLFAIADGFALQRLSDPAHDHSATLDAGIVASRHLLTGK